METLKLHWLGHPLIELKGRGVKLETRKAAALLAYLSLNPGECPREILATMFWQEGNQQKALANLRRTLSSLNSSLPGWIEADRETITLKRNGKLWVDVEAFHQSLSQLKEHSHPENEVCDDCLPVLDEIVELYRGDFLEGLNLSDSPNFDDWQFFQRDGLRQEFAEVLQRLSFGRSRLGQWDQAIIHARRWVALDRLHEPASRALMNLYARSGQKTAALRQYEELARSLNEQMGQEPEAETRRLVEQIRGWEEAKQVVESPERPIAFPLLKTKLYIHTAPVSRVIRSHLIKRLGEVEKKALTVISAPAGFGKTTLLAEWIAQTSLPIAWLSLDNGDNDPYRFLSYLIAALGSIHEEVGLEAQHLMRSPQLALLHVILASLLNDLGKVAEPYVLVMDDYQFITEHAVHEAMAYLLDHIPSNMRLVISTRADPPLQLGRLRAHGQMMELRTRDLRFTPEEATNFLNEVMRLGLSEKDIETLETRTEGWVVGLKMAALSLQRHENASEFIQAFSGSHRYVLDYLVEEVLRCQPAHIQTFLLETSILEKLNGSLCDALMTEEWRQSQENGQAVLEHLEKSNLFLIPLDDNKQWYRYHHLFADLLQSRLALNNSVKIPTLQVQASEWFERHDMVDESIRYATVAKDYRRVLLLVGQNAPAMIKTGRLTKILGWLQPLPEDLILSDPWIATLFAWGLITKGEMERAEPYLLTALNKIQPAIQTGAMHELLGTIATLRALIVENRGDLQGTIEMAHLALKHLNVHDEVAIASVKFALGRAYYMNGNLEKAKELCEEALQASDRTETNNAIAPMASLLGFALVLEGKLNEAEMVFRHSIDMMGERGFENCFVSGLIYLDLGELMLQRNQLQDARRLIEKGIEQNKRWGVITISLLGLTVHARYMIAIGELQTAEVLLLQAGKLQENIDVLSDISSAFSACQVQYFLAKGDPQSAYSLLLENQITLHDDLNFRNELNHIMLARILIARRQLDEAVTLLDRLETAANNGGRNGRLIEILALQAIALQEQNKTDKSLLMLRKSLSLSESEGYVRVFLNEGRPMIKLLNRLKSSKLTPPLKNYVNRLLEASTPV